MHVCVLQREELQDLRKKSPCDLWTDDLDQFLATLQVSMVLAFCSHSEMGIVWLSLEFWHFDGPQGQSQDLSKSAEKSCIRICTS